MRPSGRPFLRSTRSESHELRAHLSSTDPTRPGMSDICRGAAARWGVGMNSKAFGALAACMSGLAMVLCGLSVAAELPTPVEVAMLVEAVFSLASAGGFIDAAVAAQKKATA